MYPVDIWNPGVTTCYETLRKARKILWKQVLLRIRARITSVVQVRSELKHVVGIVRILFSIGLAMFGRFMLQDVPQTTLDLFSHKCENHVLKNLEFLRKEGVQFPSPIYSCPQVCGGSMTIQNTTHQRSFILMLMYIIIFYFLSAYKTSCNLREVGNMLQWTWHTQETMMCMI